MTMRNLLLAGGMAANVLFGANASFAGTCSSSDLSLTIGSTTYAPASCADTVANGNPAQETANLNAALGTTGFVYLDKSEGNDTPGNIGGIQFTVTTTAGNTGTWTITWVDTDTTTLPNLPLTMDLEVGLFGGSTGSGYLFDDVLLTQNPNSGSGTFAISFFTSGPHPNHPAISHLTLTGGNVQEVVNTPEPISIALLGTGLLGLGLIRRSRRA